MGWGILCKKLKMYHHRIRFNRRMYQEFKNSLSITKRSKNQNLNKYIIHRIKIGSKHAW